jgi:nucleoside phosphorylase
MPSVEEQKQLARYLLARGLDEIDLSPEPVDPDTLPPEPELLADLGLPFPEGLAPIPRPLADLPDRDAAISEQADVLVITWTVAELNGLADVLTPGFSRRTWYQYRHRFDEHYDPQIRQGAPAKKSRRLGSWFPTRIGSQSVICFKSELHLNQDGVNLDDEGNPTSSKTGRATLPVKDLFLQLIDEIKPRLVITTGTSGATFLEHDLGDVVVTRAAKFRLSDEFGAEPFNGETYTSDWPVPKQRFTVARELMGRFSANLIEPAFAPPTKRYPFEGVVRPEPGNTPDIKLDGEQEMPEFHPILTTDFFEFGTSTNNLEEEGAAVEMGDAVLGLACQDLDDPPLWLVARNISDPQINGDLPTEPRKLNMQTHWAVWYYEKYGYWTSVNGALACWAVIAGL